MTLTGNKILGVAKKIADSKIVYLLSSEKHLIWNLVLVIK